MLNWISEDDLQQCVRRLLQGAKDASRNAKKRRESNATDPFSSLLIAHTFGYSDPAGLETLQDAESALRGMSNALGEFHQSILGAIDGWVNHDAGYDLECESRKIIAEVKNKWNTMNATNRAKVEDDLRTALRQKRGDWKACIVQIIPRNPERKIETITPKKLYVMDGASFYRLATGDVNALHDLFDAVCDIVSLSSEMRRHCRNILEATISPGNPSDIENAFEDE